MKRLIFKGLRRLRRGQGGQILPLSLALLTVGSLVVVPLLNLSGTALSAGIDDDFRLRQHYAANGGVMDGLRELIADNPNLPEIGNDWTYSLPDANGSSVNVTVTAVDEYTWKITGMAAGGDEATELESCVEVRHYSPYAIIATSVSIGLGTTVNGDVQYDSTLGTLTNNGDINGETIDRPIEWPSLAEVQAFYLEQVDGAPVQEGNLTINLGTATIGNPYSLGPLYINGNLTITATTTGAFRLDGPVYVTGNVAIGNGVRMYQNKNVIYADGAGGIGLNAGSTAYGAGGIVARESIAVNYSTIVSSYSIIWSLQGTVTCNPTGHFRGMLYAGEADTAGTVTTTGGKVIDFVVPAEDLNLPLLPGDVFRITAWEETSAPAS